MKCYTLTNSGKIENKLPAGIYRDDKVLKRKNVIANASVAVEFMPCLDVNALLAEEPLNAFHYGIVSLISPPAESKKKQIKSVIIPEQSVLVSLDMTVYYCSPPYGDRSRLLDWNGNLGLFLCPIGGTRICTRNDRKKIYINNNNRLARASNPSKLIKASAASREHARITSGSLLMKI